MNEAQEILFATIKNICNRAVTLVSQLAAFSTFTYFPPPFSLFEDSRNGMRGIPAEAEARPMNHAGPRAALGP